jgi:hypothetical protein
VINFKDLKVGTFFIVGGESIFHIFDKEDDNLITRAYWLNKIDVDSEKFYYSLGNITYFSKGSWDQVNVTTKITFNLNSLDRVKRHKLLICILRDE